MAERDDVRRVLAECNFCGSVYAARQWPDGNVRIIGQTGCQCGADSFTVIDDDDVLEGDEEFGTSAGTSPGE